jgi:hypothetical protein
MKKIFATLFAVMFLFAGTAMATENSRLGTGFFGVFAEAGDAQGDIDLSFGSNSVAFGANGGFGKTEAQAGGYIQNGYGYVGVFTAGGSQGNTWTSAGTDFAASQSVNFAGTEGGVNAFVNPDGYGYGYADGSFRGFAAQGSLNATAVVGGNGFTGGIAGQGSLGRIYGEVGVFAGPDYYNDCYGWNYNSYAGASAGAGILMNGGSASISQHVAGPGYDGLRTDVGAFTSITSYGHSNTGAGWWNDYAYSHTSGGWCVIGGAATMTATDNGKAVAYGIYTGQGSLNYNYTGNATGFSQVETFTSPNLNGSYVKSAAGMSVTSKVTPSIN